jgi:hypothetical protein
MCVCANEIFPFRTEFPILILSVLVCVSAFYALTLTHSTTTTQKSAFSELACVDAILRMCMHDRVEEGRKKSILTHTARHPTTACSSVEMFRFVQFYVARLHF